VQAGPAERFVRFPVAGEPTVTSLAPGCDGWFHEILSLELSPTRL
jgi:hypothetical protein